MSACFLSFRLHITALSTEIILSHIPQQTHSNMLHNTERTAREITAKLVTRVEFWKELSKAIRKITQSQRDFSKLPSMLFQASQSLSQLHPSYNISDLIALMFFCLDGRSLINVLSAHICVTVCKILSDITLTEFWKKAKDYEKSCFGFKIESLCQQQSFKKA